MSHPRRAFTRPKAQDLIHRLQRFLHCEAGTATIEFSFFMPITILIFLASVESGYYTIRHVMLERGLDLVMREFRLGRLATASHNDIRNLICDATPLLRNCRSQLKVWIEPVNTTTWVMPQTPAYCGDRNGQLESTPPSGSVNTGDSDQIMIVRICTLQNPLFPTTQFTSRLRADSVNGGYQLATATVVVNEPR